MDFKKYKNLFLSDKDEQTIWLLLIIFLFIWVTSTIVFIGFCHFYNIKGDADSTSAYINLMAFDATFFASITALFLYNNWKKQAVYNDVLNGVAKARVEIRNLKPKFEELIKKYTDENYFKERTESPLALRINQIHKEMAQYPDDPLASSFSRIELPIIEDKNLKISFLENKINELKVTIKYIEEKYEELNLKCEMKTEIKYCILKEFENIFYKLRLDYEYKIEHSLYDSYRRSTNRLRYGKFSDSNFYVHNNIFVFSSKNNQGIKNSFYIALDNLISEFDKFPDHF
ncbi:hypothetical protein ABTE70_20430 [Acinetobacter baumannii]